MTQSYLRSIFKVHDWPTIIKVGYDADVRDYDKYKANIKQHTSLCQTHKRNGNEVNVYPELLGR